MKTNNKKYLNICNEIKKNGIAIVENYFSKKQCKNIKKKLDKALLKRIKKKIYCGNDTYQVLDNYFMDDFTLAPMIFQTLTDLVMKNLIDDDYVLISPSARNTRINNKNFKGSGTSGLGWHTDSRFIQSGRGFNPSFSYMSIICIDEFKKENGCTHFIPKSHLRYKRPKNREANLKYKFMTAPIGSIIYIDTALWHRAGQETSESRWGIFNTYGPWFIKPYHRFYEMFSRKQIKKLKPVLKQLLHFDSITPKSHLERMNTLQKYQK